MSNLPPEVAALVEAATRQLMRSQDLPAVSLELTAAAMDNDTFRAWWNATSETECATRLLLTAAPSPPAPVEDDGLDEHIRRMEAMGSIYSLAGDHVDQRLRWYRELQARRRGER